VVSFTPSHFTHEETAPGTHCIRGWIGPRVGLEIIENRKYLASTGKQTPDYSVAQPTVYALNKLTYRGSFNVK
jgi:hypothetical protein